MSPSKSSKMTITSNFSKMKTAKSLKKVKKDFKKAQAKNPNVEMAYVFYDINEKEADKVKNHHLQIDTLIGQFVVVNIPLKDDKRLGQFSPQSIEDLKSQVVSALLETVKETYNHKESSDK